MLTIEEKALAGNAAILLTKNRIIQAVYDLFGQLAEVYKIQAVDLPTDVTHLHPKISRGENYLGLPWVMLDYPRMFVDGNTFAIRTMFWWGHYFSLHLLLQGDKMRLLNAEKLAEASGWYFSKAANPWQHQYEAELTIPAHAVSTNDLEIQAKAGFYKLSIYLPLAKWDTAENFLAEKFDEITRMMM